MGEIADMMLDGTLCQICGTLMEDLIQKGTNVLKEPPGYPRTCSDCLKEERKPKKKKGENKARPKCRASMK